MSTPSQNLVSASSSRDVLRLLRLSGAIAAVLIIHALTTEPYSAAQTTARTVGTALTAPDTAGEPSTGEDSIGSPQMIAWLQQLVRENLPEDYEDTKKWGHQKEVWDGLDVSHDGLKIKTKRKHKLVNDGTWTRYKLTMVDPDRNLVIHFHRLQAMPDGRIAFDVSVDMVLDVFGRLSQWVRDVQLISLSANADAHCSMRTTGTVAVRMNPLKLPPDIIVQPHVDTAEITIHEFRVRRISQVGGPAAKHLGEGLKHVLDDKLEETNRKLPEKINRGFAKYEQKLTFSLQDWLRSKLPLPEQSSP
ncbi:MAG: hypothetical protein U0892_09210 [Pirellulales bacterium]